MTERVLTARELNRATLARQLLLERATLDPVDAIERLGGLQAQEAASPYLALWTRLDGFAATDLDRAFAARRVVKATLMRTTLHAVSAPDLAAYWPALEGTLRSLRDRTQAWPETAMPLDAIAARILEAAGQPRSGVELRALAAEMAPFDGLRDAWRGVRLSAPFVIVPERVPWSFGRRPLFQSARSWLESPFSSPEDGLDHLVRRHLAAFGPASLTDIARWSRIERGRLKPAFERLAPELRRFRDEAGRLLYDVAGGALPPGDTPAPPRLLPMWDSVLLAHEDGSRLTPEPYRRRMVMPNGDYLPAFLVDGRVGGLWRAEVVEGRTSIKLDPFEPLAPDDERMLQEEGDRLARFVEPLEPAVYRRYTRMWATPADQRSRRRRPPRPSPGTS